MAEIFGSGSIDQRQLDNGLTAIVRVDRSAPVVAIVTYLSVGYFDELDELAGISHVLEHMFFKGTPTRGPGAIAQETKAAGGLLNAATIYDYTTYYTILPSDSLEQGLAIQSDALLNSVIDEGELRRELQVIIQEAKRKLDNPSAVASESLYELMFEQHRMRRWRIGTEAFLNGLTRDQLVHYYRSMYRGDTTVLVVAGDVDPEHAHSLIQRYYRDLPGAGSAARDFGPPETGAPGLRFAEKAGDIVHSHLELGWHTPATLADDTPVLDMLAVVLGQGRAARLYRGVREQGLVTSITARNYTPTALGVFQISAELETAKASAALSAIADGLAGLDQIEENELTRARSIIEARLLRRLESMEGQANFIAEWQALGDWKLGADYLERIANIKAADLSRVARQYLNPAHASVFFYHPRGEAGLGDEAPVLSSLLGGNEPFRAPVEELEAEPVGPAPRRAKQRAVEDQVHSYEADDGLRIFVKRRAAAPLVSIAVAASGGANLEQPAQAGWTGLMARASVKGTARRSAYELALGAEARGASVQPSLTADAVDWYISAPARHLDGVLDLVTDVALNPSFPEEEVERERQIALTDLQQVRDDMYRYPLRMFLESAFPDHPYGYSLDQMTDALTNATAADLRNWHAQTIGSRDLSVFIVGDVDPDDAATRAAACVKSRPGPALQPSESVWPKVPVERVETRAKAQTALVLGYPGADRNHDDLYPLQVLASTIAGLGGRWFEELRSKRSLAYTVTASPIARLLGGAFITYIATAPEREAEATACLLEEIDRLRQELLPADDVERAKRYMIGSWQIRAQTNGAQLGDLASAILLGHGLAELREYEDKVRAVTPQQIRAVAQHYFDDNKLIRTIVRGTGGAR